MLKCLPFSKHNDTVAVITGWLLRHGQSDAIPELIVLSEEYRHSGNLVTVFIYLTPYRFSNLRTFIKILSCFENILLIYQHTDWHHGCMHLTNLTSLKTQKKFLKAKLDLYKIWWQWFKYVEAYACSLCWLCAGLQYS